MKLTDVRNYVQTFISGISPRGLLRLDRSEPYIDLPLQNLPVHTGDYHSGTSLAKTIYVQDTNSYFFSHDLEQILAELYSMISSGSAGVVTAGGDSITAGGVLVTITV